MSFSWLTDKHVCVLCGGRGWQPPPHPDSFPEPCACKGESRSITQALGVPFTALRRIAGEPTRRKPSIAREQAHVSLRVLERIAAVFPEALE